MSNSKAISGTELVESILGGPNVDRLLAAFHNKEHAVLEFKASWKPCEGDDASDDDCRWNVIKGIIAMANASGGCIVLGIAENRSSGSKEKLLAGDCDPDCILKNPKLGEKNLVEHTLSELFKGDGFFKIKTSRGRQERLKVEDFDRLRTFVEPVEVCDCKTISEKVLVLIVHPCKDNNFIFVNQLPESRTSDSASKQVLFYRDSDLPETHRIEDDMAEVAKYCNRRKIEQLKYTRILNVAEGKPQGLRKKLVWWVFFVLLAATALVGVKKYNDQAEIERQKRKEEQRAREEAQRKAEEEQRAREEAQRKAEEERQRAEQDRREAEEAQRKAEEAQRKAEEATRKAEEYQRHVEQLQASNTATKKERDDVQAKLDEATKAKSSAELAAESAKQFAREMKDRADNAVVLYKSWTEERKQWESYCKDVKEKQTEYGKDMKNHCDHFVDGLKTKAESVKDGFNTARKQIPAIAEKLTGRNVVLSIVRNALGDKQEGKTNNLRLRDYIGHFLKSYSNSCAQACEKLVNDGRDYEGRLQNRFEHFRDVEIKNCSAALTKDVEMAIDKQVASSQVPLAMFPDSIFKEDSCRIEKISDEIVSHLVKGRTWKKAIGDMKALLEKYPDTSKWHDDMDVSKLQKELGVIVTKELNATVDAIERDAVKQVSKAAEEAQKAYLKAGDELVKAATKKPK